VYDNPNRPHVKPPRMVHHRIVMPVASLASPSFTAKAAAPRTSAAVLASGTGRLGAANSSVPVTSTNASSQLGDSVRFAANIVAPIFVENTRISVRDRNPLLQKRATRAAVSPTMPMRYAPSPTKGTLPQISNVSPPLKGMAVNSRAAAMDRHLRDLQQLCVDLGWDE
jgi:hypothetical protein